MTRTLLSLGLVIVCSGCLAIPYGSDAVQAPEPLGLGRPIVALGQMKWVAPQERHPLIQDAIAERASNRQKGSSYVSTEGLSEEERLSFSRFTPGDSESYERVKHQLPPHYLLRYEVNFDGSDLPSDAELGLLGFAHGYLLLTFPSSR